MCKSGKFFEKICYLPANSDSDPVTESAIWLEVRSTWLEESTVVIESFMSDGGADIPSDSHSAVVSAGLSFGDNSRVTSWASSSDSRLSCLQITIDAKSSISPIPYALYCGSKNKYSIKFIRSIIRMADSSNYAITITAYFTDKQ